MKIYRYGTFECRKWQNSELLSGWIYTYDEMEKFEWTDSEARVIAGWAHRIIDKERKRRKLEFVYDGPGCGHIDIWGR